jgi:hypothetical protein
MNANSMTEARRAGIFVEASGKDFQAPCRSDRVAVRKDNAAPTALGRIELKIPIIFSTRFGNGGRLQRPPLYRRPIYGAVKVPLNSLLTVVSYSHIL